MLAKIGVLIGILLTALWVIRMLGHLRQSRPGSGRNPRPTGAESELVACPRCGAFVPHGKCSCDRSERG